MDFLARTLFRVGRRGHDGFEPLERSLGLSLVESAHPEPEKGAPRPRGGLDRYCDARACSGWRVIFCTRQFVISPT
jgi:hypothetical protein